MTYEVIDKNITKLIFITFRNHFWDSGGPFLQRWAPFMFSKKIFLSSIRPYQYLAGTEFNYVTPSFGIEIRLISVC